MRHLREKPSTRFSHNMAADSSRCSRTPLPIWRWPGARPHRGRNQTPAGWPGHVEPCCDELERARAIAAPSCAKPQDPVGFVVSWAAARPARPSRFSSCPDLFRASRAAYGEMAGTAPGHDEGGFNSPPSYLSATAFILAEPASEILADHLVHVHEKPHRFEPEKGSPGHRPANAGATFAGLQGELGDVMGREGLENRA